MKTRFLLLLLSCLFNFSAMSQINDAGKGPGWIIKTDPLAIMLKKLQVGVERKILPSLSAEVKGGYFRTGGLVGKRYFEGGYGKVGLKLYLPSAKSPINKRSADRALQGAWIKAEWGITNFTGFKNKVDLEGYYPFFNATAYHYKVTNQFGLVTIGKQVIVQKRLAIESYFGFGMQGGMGIESAKYDENSVQMYSRAGNNFSHFAFTHGKGLIFSVGFNVGLAL
jgi:hypothetical protein